MQIIRYFNNVIKCHKMLFKISSKRTKAIFPRRRRKNRRRVNEFHFFYKPVLYYFIMLYNINTCKTRKKEKI